MIDLLILHQLSNLLNLPLALIVCLFVLLCSAFLSINFFLQMNYFLLESVKVVILIPHSHSSSTSVSKQTSSIETSKHRIRSYHIVRGKRKYVLLSGVWIIWERLVWWLWGSLIIEIIVVGRAIEVVIVGCVVMDLALRRVLLLSDELRLCVLVLREHWVEIYI